MDGNIVGSSPVNMQMYKYGTEAVPSREFENLVRLLATDEIEACFIYHQLIQGNVEFSKKG